MIRSFLGGTLPLAGPSMYRALGPNWAGTLLGLLEVMIIPIPFVFYKYGHKIREKSALITEMRENEERQERKRKRAAERMQRQLRLTQSGKEIGLSDKEKELEAEKELNRQATVVDYGRDKETNV